MWNYCPAGLYQNCQDKVDSFPVNIFKRQSLLRRRTQGNKGLNLVIKTVGAKPNGIGKEEKEWGWAFKFGRGFFGREI